MTPGRGLRAAPAAALEQSSMVLDSVNRAASRSRFWRQRSSTTPSGIRRSSLGYGLRSGTRGGRGSPHSPGFLRAFPAFPRSRLLVEGRRLKPILPSLRGLKGRDPRYSLLSSGSPTGWCASHCGSASASDRPRGRRGGSGPEAPQLAAAHSPTRCHVPAPGVARPTRAPPPARRSC